MKELDLKSFLDEKADRYNRIEFIDDDPIQIPHRFSLKQDREISGFLAATIAWGNRKSIIKDAEKMLALMDHTPFDFVSNATVKEIDSIPDGSVHRTFNSEDFKFFLRALQRIYRQNDSMETLFLTEDEEFNFYHALERFRKAFLNDETHRAMKHVSSTYKNSAAKRLIMFLRWMVRQDKKGVDFGIWKKLNPAHLSIPLDVHSGNIARQLGLLQRKQNDWKAVVELDVQLRRFNSTDPAVYDFALFGLGVSDDLQ